MGSAQAEGITTREYQIKAAYLYNILKFVRWPEASPGAKLNVCVYGQNPFGEILKELENRPVQGYVVHVDQVQGASIKACQVVFIETGSAVETRKAIEAFGATGSLTIGDREGFVADGGIVGFVAVSGAIRFELNMTRAKAQGLMLNSQLAATALEVR